ncbi:MAG: OB-fold nucleic acid binding domain-containing protein, partial [Deltaproteobacteria bacterium]
MNLTVEKNGSLILPPELISSIGFSSGDVVAIDISNGEVRLTRTPPILSSARTGGTLADSIARKNLQTGIQFIKGIGPKLAALLEKRDIRTVEDALYLMPLRYEDRRELIPVSRLSAGQSAVFSGKVISADVVTTRGGRRVFEALVSDDSGTITCKWFNANSTWMKRTWKVGHEGVFSGEVNQYGYQREVHHPDVEWLPEGADLKAVLAADPANFGRIVPV